MPQEALADEKLVAVVVGPGRLERWRDALQQRPDEHVESVHGLQVSRPPRLDLAVGILDVADRQPQLPLQVIAVGLRIALEAIAVDRPDLLAEQRPMRVLRQVGHLHVVAESTDRAARDVGELVEREDR